MTAILTTTLEQVVATLAHNWPFLVVGALVATFLRVFADSAVLTGLLRRHGAASVPLATTLAVATPLCSCGTMAVVLGMAAGAMPWAPIVAFMAASPLTSPEELVLSAGLFGWPFALAFFAASIAIGLLAGLAAHLLERRGWLAGQARFVAPPRDRHPAGLSLPAAPPPRPGPRELAVATARTTAMLLALFVAFAFVGFLINNLIPPSWVSALFGRGNRLGVPLAALLGLPLYVNSEASLPLVKAFVANGASPGAALAFLITGAGTSLGAVAGALTVARWRVIGVVVVTLLVGAVAGGYAFDLGGTVIAAARMP
ncbi:MAG: permease [Acidobacteria bacterium]|nr:permease [Acidobacteriota bacterium]